MVLVYDVKAHMRQKFVKHFVVQARTDKSVGFSHLQQRSSKDIASFCVQLLPALCSHLENCHNYFQVRKSDCLKLLENASSLSFISCVSALFPQTLLSENNGVVDGPATDAQEHQLMSSCCQLLLQVLNTTFSW